MIDFLQGTLVAKSPATVSIQVAGVGLFLRVPLSTYQELPPEGSPARLLTHLHVREEELSLYGFATREERELFRMLLGVSRIGPAVALRVLSSCSVAQFVGYVLDENADALRATVKGIGPKAAARLIIELKERVGDLAVAAEEPSAGQAARDAVQALVALGEPRGAAERAVRAAVAKLGADADRQRLVEETLAR